MEKKSLIVVYTKLLLTAVFWGGTFIAGKIVVRHVGPFSAAFLRFAIALILLIALLWKMEGKIPRLKASQILPIFLLGMTGVVLYNIFFLKALKLIEANRASMIVANNPIVIALCSAYFFKEKLTPMKIAGILVSITGAVVVISRGHLSSIFQGGVGRGELFMLGCVASWVMYSLIGKSLMRDLTPLTSVTYSVLIGTLILLIPAVSAEQITRQLATYSWQEWASLAYLGVFGTVFGFLWYYQGILAIGPTRAGLFINFVPISAVILAYLMLGESITPSLIIGAAFVISGVYLTNRTTLPKI